MKTLFKNMMVGLLATIGVASCTDDTGSLGIYPNENAVSTSTASFLATTRSMALGSITANNANAYLGKVVDPETGGVVTADFAAQFHCFEDYMLPEKSQMIGNITINPANGDTLDIERGVVKCDSVEVRIFLNSFYGDGNNPMKLEVYELDSENIMEEATTYKTDIDLTPYIKAGKPLASKVFTPTNYTIPEGERESSSYTNNIRIMLPVSLGQRILEMYYETPSYFKNSYTFIRNVFPGLYFRISNGEGTMLTTQVSMVNLFYKYEDDRNGKIYNGMTRFAATPEVIQSTRISNGNLSQLLQHDDFTYLKTPAGICTEMTLPIDEVFDQHPNDSISKAEITLTRYNKVQDSYQLGTPTSLLMVRKNDMKAFFENNEVANGKTNYVTTFNAPRNSYTFYNIARLLSYCKNEKKQSAQKAGISEAEWAAQNPDWNKVLIIPVTTSSSNNVLTSINHDMQMNSIRLVGGKTPLKMDVIYSKFEK